MMQEHSSISSSKKKNYIIIMRIIIFILCVGIIFNLTGEKYKKAGENNVVNYFTKSRFDDFYSLQKNSLDMVFIGSSHSYCTFDPENFDGTMGISSFQLGTPLQNPDTSYYLLREILNYQHPKVVVMEIYWDVLDDKFEMKQANSFFDVLRNEKLKHEYMEKVFPLGEKIKYSLLPIRYQQDYFAYEADIFQKRIEEKYDVHKKNIQNQYGKEEYRSKGYVYCDMGMLESEFYETNQFKCFDGKKWSIDETQKKYIDKIINICRQEGIELVFVTAPIAPVSMEYIENYDLVNSCIEAFAKKNDIKYIDYNIVDEEEALLKNDNFRDDAHLNDSGVKIINRHFKNWLIENTGLIN